MATDNELLGEILEQVELINQNLSGSDYDEVVGDASFQDVDADAPLVRAADPLSVKVTVSVITEDPVVIREDDIIIGIGRGADTFVLPTAGKGEIAVSTTTMGISQISIATYRKLPS